MKRYALGTTLALLALTGCSDPPSSASSVGQTAEDLAASSRPGAVFTTSNDAAGNEVLVYERAADGSLRAAGRYATGGHGTGAGLGSQGAVLLSHDGRRLLVVDAGSNEVTSFRVLGTRLELASRVTSGGTQPVSLTLHEGLVYVLNTGSNDLFALRLHEDGTLSPAFARTTKLSVPDAGPAQVAFVRNGEAILVTEKKSNTLDLFPLDRRGFPEAGRLFASNGQTPFGFAISHGRAFVSEAFGGMPGKSAVSSYAVDRDGDSLFTVSRSVPDHQAAACWVVVTGDGRFAYTSNTASSTISGYAVSTSGALSLLDGSGVSATTGEGTKPADMALDRGSQHLYVLSGGKPSLRGYTVGADGSLAPAAEVDGLPPAAAGLAAR